MAGTRKTRVPMVEQIRLINECRQSGMTDADWCRENDIAVSKGQMASAYGSTFVPSGWLIPFNYIRTGREISGRAKVRLIVPHSEGQKNASAYVYPCYYEITYQLGR